MSENKMLKLVEALRRSTKQAEALRAALRSAESASNEPIAVVSMACRAPGDVSTPEALWRVFEEGRDQISPFPERWDGQVVYDPEPETRGATYTREGGFLAQIDAFDAAFFGISPKEAVAMEPQQRLVLEVAWEALERMGIAPLTLKGTPSGVFIGAFAVDYGAQELDELDGYSGTGRLTSVISGRLSYVLGLHGPAMTVDTACSSSLVALHLAMTSLRLRECDLALAGGVQVMITPAPFVEFSRLRGQAPDGRCKAFSADADGAGWAEGCGVLVLKRLSDAQRDGDRVLALLRSSAVNHDGRSQGLTAPNGPSQQRVIRRALELSRLEPTDIDAIEAHGTGTRLGDPIEAGALAAVFGPTRAKDRPLWLGSSKSNLGHAQAAAGALGVIKMVLALQHERLPKTLHAATPSEHITWEGSGLALLQASRPWPRAEGHVRRAGVSSFGVSGTNAHVVLEEAPAQAPPKPLPMSATLPLLLSGRDVAALRAQAGRWASWLEAHPEADWASVRRTAALHRTAFDVRAAVLVADRDEAPAALRALAEARSHAALIQGRARQHRGIVFVFPGQGSQWPGMGRALLASSPTFADTITRCEEALRPHTGWSVTAALRGDAGAPSLERVDVVQPALFAMAVGLAALWQELGVSPDAVVGHSQGEIAAAVVAGALSVEDGARVVARRSQLVRTLGGRGGMAVVELPVEEVERELDGAWPGLSVAVVNTATSTVIAGDASSVERFVRVHDARGVFCRRVDVDYASHSEHVAPTLPALRDALTGIRPQRAHTAFYSTVRGGLLDAPVLDADYWCENLRRPVRLDRALGALLATHHDVFIEISAHPVLAMPLATACAGVRGVVVGSLRRDQGGLSALHRGLAELHCQGVAVDWAARMGAQPGGLAPLPTYAFQRQRYWWEARAPLTPSSSVIERAGLLGEALSTPLPIQQYKGVLRYDALVDHEAVEGRGGASALLEVLVEAGRAYAPGAGWALRALSWGSPLCVKPGEALALHTLVQPGEGGEAAMSVHAAVRDGETTSWRLLVSARGQRFDVDDSPRAVPALADEPPRSLWSTLRFHAVLVGRQADPDGALWLRVAVWERETPLGAACMASLLRALALGVAQELMPERPPGTPRLLGCASAELSATFPDEVVARVPSARALDAPAPGLRLSVELFQVDGTPLARFTDLELQWAEELEITRGDQDPAAVLQDVLNVVAPQRLAQLGPDEDLLAAGMDSLTTLSLYSEFAQRVGVAAPFSTLLERTRQSGGLTRRSLLEWAGHWGLTGAAPSPPNSALSSPSQAPATWVGSLPAPAELQLKGQTPSFGLWRDPAGVALEVISMGEGPRPWILLPPFGCEMAVWLPVMTRLAQARPVVALNYPGFGRSPAQAHLQHVEQLADAVQSVLSALVPDAPWDLVGWSLGGFVSQVIAATQAARVGRLTLINTTDHLGVELRSPADSEVLMIRLETDLRRALDALTAEAREEAERLVYRGKRTRGPSIGAQYLNMIAAFNREGRGGEVVAPTQIIAGDRDLCVPLSHHQRLHRSIPGSRLAVVPGVGHYTPLFRPEAVVALLEGGSGGG